MVTEFDYDENLVKNLIEKAKKNGLESQTRTFIELTTYQQKNMLPKLIKLCTLAKIPELGNDNSKNTYIFNLNYNLMFSLVMNLIEINDLDKKRIIEHLSKEIKENGENNE